MLTASYLSSNWNFRPEFRIDTDLSRNGGMCDTVGAIDAPNRIPAGSVKFQKYMTIPGGYPSPSAIGRE